MPSKNEACNEEEFIGDGRDYFRVGLPPAVVTLAITMWVLPVFWPLVP
jgi:hypothetical protein